jgi:MATE family multidrug resistance protein
VDTWIIGHLPGPQFLAAVGIGSLVFSYIFWACGFLRMSTTGLVAQAHGRGDTGQIARTLLRSLLMAAAIGAAVLLLVGPIKGAAQVFFAPPDDTIGPLGIYLDIRLYAAPAALLCLGINGYLIGRAQARLALWLQLVLNIANAALSLLFVLGFGMGVAGVALGSLIAEWLAVIIGAGFVLRTLGAPALRQAFRDGETYALAKMKKLLAVNSFIFLRTLLMLLAFGLITREAAALGEVALAAHHVLNIFMMLIALGLDGFAYAAEALTGAAFGRRARQEFRAWVGYGLLWSALAAVIYAAGFFFLGEPLVTALTDIESVRTAAGNIMPVMALLPLVGTWCYLFDGVYIGATAAAAMFGTSAAATALFALALAPLTEAYGLTGLWLSVCVFLGGRGLAQALWYPRLEAGLEE